MTEGLQNNLTDISRRFIRGKYRKKKNVVLIAYRNPFAGLSQQTKREVYRKVHIAEAGENNSPKLDLVGACQDGRHSPLGQFAAVVLQLCGQHCTTLTVQSAAPVHTTRKLTQHNIHMLGTN